MRAWITDFMRIPTLWQVLKLDKARITARVRVFAKNQFLVKCTFLQYKIFWTHPGGSATAEAPCITSSWAGVLFLFVRVTLHQIELELMCTIGLQLSIGEDKYIIALLDDARLVPLSYKPNVLFHVRSSHVNVYFRLIGQKICDFKFPFNRRLSDFSDFHGIKI